MKYEVLIANPNAFSSSSAMTKLINYWFRNFFNFMSLRGPILEEHQEV